MSRMGARTIRHRSKNCRKSVTRAPPQLVRTNRRFIAIYSGTRAHVSRIEYIRMAHENRKSNDVDAGPKTFSKRCRELHCGWSFLARAQFNFFFFFFNYTLRRIERERERERALFLFDVSSLDYFAWVFQKLLGSIPRKKQ